MAKAYSYDLRQKVINAIEMDGMKKSEASQIFNISRNTINLWFQRLAATGDVQVKPRGSASSKCGISIYQGFLGIIIYLLKMITCKSSGDCYRFAHTFLMHYQ